MERYESAIRGYAYANNGSDRRHHCPACHDTRKNKHDKSLSVRVEDGAILYNCWHCSMTGKLHMVEPTPVAYKIIAPAPSENNPAYNYLASRGITRSVAMDAGILYQPDQWVAGKEQRAIGFPYIKDGVAYAAKWRGIDEKSFTQTGAANTLWQLDRIAEGAPLVICEGELDALSLWQAGIPAVSVPNGAPSKVSDGRSSPLEDKKYQYLWDARKLIDKAPKVIIACDNDTQGEALGEELARRLGRGKCWKVLWPDGCKDANDVLRRDGRVALAEAVEQAKPWPVKGLYEAVHFAERIGALYDKGLVRGESTGFADVDDIYTVMPGQLCIVTGIPSMGKSTFVDQVMVNLAKRKGWRFAVCSFENEPSVHIAKLMQLHTGKPFFDGPTPRMTKADKEVSLSWVNDHFSFLYQGDGHQSTIDDILDRLRSAVLRYGIRGAVIDPANFVDRPRDMNETDWVSEALTKIKVFIMAHDVHLWFISHPSKMYRKDDGKYAVPGGYDISGSAHWFNKADVGMTVHRPDLQTDQSQIHIWKMRHSFIGKVGQASLMYDRPTGAFYEPQQAWQPQPLPSRGSLDLN